MVISWATVMQVLRAPSSLGRGIGGCVGSPRKSGAAVRHTNAIASSDVSTMQRGDKIIGAAVALPLTLPAKAATVQAPSPTVVVAVSGGASEEGDGSRECTAGVLSGEAPIAPAPHAQGVEAALVAAPGSVGAMKLRRPSP